MYILTCCPCPVVGYITGFAAVGFGARCYQLAIMKRNIFESECAMTESLMHHCVMPVNACTELTSPGPFSRPSHVLSQTSVATLCQQVHSQVSVSTSTTQSESGLRILGISRSLLTVSTRTSFALVSLLISFATPVRSRPSHHYCFISFIILAGTSECNHSTVFGNES